MSIYVMVAFVEEQGKENLNWDSLKAWKKVNWRD